MELSEHMSLGDLRTAIKEFKKSAPRLTSKKSDLHAFATRVGLVKKKEEEPVQAVAAVPEKPKKAEKVKVVSSELPEALKKPVAKTEVVKAPKKAVAAPEPPKKKGSAFSSYMSSMKGKGYSMSQLAQMYKEQKA